MQEVNMIGTTLSWFLLGSNPPVEENKEKPASEAAPHTLVLRPWEMEDLLRDRCANCTELLLGACSGGFNDDCSLGDYEE